MKLSRLSGLIVAVAAVAVIFCAIDAAPALAAPASLAHSISTNLGFYGAQIVLAIGAENLRAQYQDIMTKATAKAAEIKDGLDAAAIARIEAEHRTLLADARTVQEALTAEEAKGTAGAKAWAAGFYMAAAETGVTLVDLNKIVAASATHEQAKDALIDAMAKAQNANKPAPGGSIAITADERERFVNGVSRAIMMKTTILSSHADAEVNEFSGYDLLSLARMCNERNGIKLMTRDPMQIVAAAFQPTMSGMHTTSDFVNILGNIANKSLLKGYEEAEETFAKWTGKGNLSDFKIATRADLGLFGNLDKVEEGAEYKYGTLSDRKDTVALATYGKMFNISRQAIINDDLDAFSKVPSKMGRAAKRTIGNLVYAILTSNPTMGDGKALFHADHGNYDTGADTALDVDSLDFGRSRMALQKDPDNKAAALNIRPRWLITPVALEGAALQHVNSQTEPGQDNPNLANRVAKVAEVVSEARLDAASSKAWYFAANQSQHETIEVLYLNGIETPTLEQMNGWKIDGVEYKVRIDTGVKAWDHRTLYKAKGEA